MALQAPLEDLKVIGGWSLNAIRRIEDPKGLSHRLAAFERDRYAHS